MITAAMLTFVVIIAGCFVYCWGHTNGYRDACNEFRRHLRNKGINIIDPW